MEAGEHLTRGALGGLWLVARLAFAPVVSLALGAWLIWDAWAKIEAWNLPDGLRVPVFMFTGVVIGSIVTRAGSLVAGWSFPEADARRRGRKGERP